VIKRIQRYVSQSIVFPCIFCGALLNARAQVNVTTYRNDNARTGQNLAETILTPATVNPNQFGRLFVQPVDGNVYAQPLYVSNLQIAGGVHNVVFVATEHDSVYAFDADSTAGANADPLWHVSFLNPAAGVSTINSSSDLGCEDLIPEVGITSTPVIYLSSNTLYVLARTKESGGFFQRLHALDITTGQEKFGSPVTIQASVPGTGYGNVGGRMVFDPLLQNQRAGLMLQNGLVYIAWASHCDYTPFSGWVMAYDARSLQQVAVWNSEANGVAGGIWQSGAAPAADSDGNVFLATGNGNFDLNTGGVDAGDSILKLGPPSAGSLPIIDYFTPYDQNDFNIEDKDLGSGGVVLLPDQPVGSPHQHLLVEACKQATLYLVDRDAMGHYNPVDNSQIVQSFSVGSNSQFNGVFSTPAFWNNTIYVGATNNALKAFSFNAGNSGLLSASPTSYSAETYGFPGPTPSISANGNTNGIVWALQNDTYNTGAAVLHAYDATNLANELYSTYLDTENEPGPAVKFTVPTIANGKVYVGTQAQLAVYGLSGTLPGAPALLSPGNGSVGAGLAPTLTWAPANGATSYDVYFGTSSSPPLVTSTTATAFSPGTLSAGTVYRWIVVARNTAGISSSAVWSFTAASAPGDAPPTVVIDTPVSGPVVQGMITVYGWALNTATSGGTAVSNVQVYVDGNFAGTATYGIPRQDVCNVYPGRPGCPNVGYTFQLNTAALAADTSHTIIVYATDSNTSNPAVGSASVTVTVPGAVAPGPPTVLIDLPTPGTILTGTTTIYGWAMDNSSASGTSINPSSLQVSVDGKPVGNAFYGVARQDVCNPYPGRPDCPNVGYTFSFNTSTLSPGAHTITVSATDTDASPDTGSASVMVTVPGPPLPGPPALIIDTPTQGSVLTGTSTISGWAIDNAIGVGTPISNVQVKVDGILLGNAAYGVARQDVCNNYPGRAGCPNVGFTFQLNADYLGAGPHTISVSAADSDGPPDIDTASVNVTVNPSGAPTVVIDAPAAGGTFLAGPITISGWALDNVSMLGTAINPASLQVSVDGNVVGNATYGVSRPDVCSVFTGRPGCPNVGFTYQLNSPLSPGIHTIAVSAADTDATPDAGSAGASINVVSTSAPPSAWIDTPVTGTTLSGTAAITGWALDNSAIVGTAIQSVQVKVDGTIVGNAFYGIPRQDVCTSFPGRAGCPNVGYTFALNTSVFSPGNHTIAVSATDTDGNPDVGSATITALFVGTAPTVHIDVPSNGSTISGTGITVSGWAIDSSTMAGSAINSSSVQVNVDGKAVGLATYGVARPDVCNSFPSRPGCPNVGFTFQLNTSALASGTHTITVSATDADTPTPDTGSASVSVTVQ
jgi:Bacterial Ig domain